MPVSGFEYNTRPYSSFRASRGSCALQHHTTATYLQQQQQQQQQHPHNNHNCSKTILSGVNPLQSSSSATSIAIKSNNSHTPSSHQHNNNNNNNSSSNNHNGFSSNFSRQQPMRSSFYGTRFTHKVTTDSPQSTAKAGGLASSNGGTTTVTVKPLTPKLVKRIESTCTQHHTKARAPNPPTQQTQCNGSTPTTVTHNGVHATPPTAHKQYLRPHNLPPTPPLRKSSNFDRFHQANLSIRQKTHQQGTSTPQPHPHPHRRRSSALSSCNGSQESLIPKPTGVPNAGSGGGGGGGSTQKRAYANTISKVAKENQPKDNTPQHPQGSQNGPAKSIKSYPAPLPPTASFRRKCKEESGRVNSSVSASPNLNQRRFISSVGINSFNATCNGKALVASPAQRGRNLSNNSSVAPSTPQMGRNRNALAVQHTNRPTNNITAAPFIRNNKTYASQHVVGSGIPLHKTGSTGSNSSSNQSSGSQGSPKSKKAFSTKFPQGLPFEDEFYRRNRSYSQSSSSNYSFYSSNGGGVGGGGGSGGGAAERGDNSTPHTPRDYEDDDDDDEFQRKPCNDESLYVDYTKVMHHHRLQQHHQHTQEYNQRNQRYHAKHSTNGASTPQTTWIGSGGGGGGVGCPSKQTTTNYDSSLNSPHSQRRSSHHSQYNNANNSTETLNSTTMTTTAVTSSLRSKAKYSNCINDYLYASNGKLSSSHSTATSDSRKSHLYSSKHLDPYQQADNGYYTHASPDSSPPPPGPSQQTDIYKAVSSWAPKCSHPTKVLIPADTNNNKRDYGLKQHQQQQQRHYNQHHSHHHYEQQTERYYDDDAGGEMDKSDDLLEPANSEYRYV
uniref:Uncharacterized protein n=1 Tax=Stomoxys calcitrans TaxID=35570 RepID=A0A1I8PFB9_STOCA